MREDVLHAVPAAHVACADTASQSVARRTFVKWAALAGGAAALESSSLLKRYAKADGETAGSAVPEGFVGNTADAISDGLPYGADKIVRCLCTNGDVCGANHVGQAYVKDGEIVRWEGCPEACSLGGLCPRSAAGMQIINSPNRIKYPMRRTNEKGVEGEFERISWDECYDTIVEAMASAIEEEGPQTIYTLTFHYGNEALKGIIQTFAKVWQTDRAYGPAGCFSDLQVGSAATLGDAYHSLKDDPLDAKLILSWGENDAVAKPTEYSESYRKAVREKGAKWIQVEPRLSETGLKADLYLPVRPGTDSYLALAMAHVIIEEGLQDQEFIDAHTFGYEEFKELVERYDPETVEQITWCPAERIREAARLYATTKPALLLVGRGGNQTGGADSNAGWLMSRAAFCLPGLTGNFGVKGSGISMEASGQPTNNLHFHWPQLINSNAQASYVEPLVESDSDAYPALGVWGAARHLIDREPYGYRVYIGNINPAASAGNVDEMGEAFKKIPLVVVNNRLAHWTASGYADILVPICTWAESYCWRPDFEEVILTEPAIEPMFESVSDITFFRELSRRLARRMGLDEKAAWPWDTDEEFIGLFVDNDLIRDEMRKRVDQGYSEYEPWLEPTLQKVVDSPTGIPNPFYAGLHDFIPFKAKNYPNEAPEGTDPEAIWFPTAAGGDYPGDGKLLFRCDWITERSNGVLPALPIPEEPQDSWYAHGNPIESGDWEESDAVKAGYNLVACGKGHRHWQFISFNQDKDGGNASSWLREAFRTAGTPCVEMNPLDAQARGLADGDLVTVESQYGKQEGVTLIVTERSMPGVIVPPCHWGKLQNKIYPYSLSLEQLPDECKMKFNPGAVGEWGAGATPTMGGQNTQSAVLCKVYAYEG